MNTSDTFPITPRFRTRRNFITGLVLSIALHGALLAGWPEAQPLHTPATLSLEQLDLNLEASHLDKAAVKKMSGPGSADLPIRTVENKFPLQNDHNKAPVAAGATDQNIAAATPSSVQPVPAEIQALPIISEPALNIQNRDAETKAPETAPALADLSVVQDEVRARFEKAKTYPALARRYGWEGQVLLGYQVEATGIINNVHVMRSSGNAVLDQSAVHTLNKVGRISASIGRDGTLLNLQLPVTYQLTRS